MKNVSDLVLRKGQQFYGIGKTAAKILGISAGVLALILFIGLLGWGAISLLYILSLHSDFSFVNFLTGLSYFGILVGVIGVPFYFMGLHFLGLGQIAKNTDNLSGRME